MSAGLPDMRSPSSPGGFRLSLALAAALLALVAVQAQAAGSASVTRVFYDPPSGPPPGCVAPLPAGGGSASASYDEPTGFYSPKWEWIAPQTITAGATGRIKASIQVNAAGLAGAGMGLRAPFEFGTNAGARTDIAAQVPVGAPGSATDEENYTFTPNRNFVDREKLYIRVGIPCVAVIYEYTGSAVSVTPRTPATPAKPRLTPRSVRPVPGVITSYASPRRGKILVLPFPKSGCSPPASSNAREAQAPAPVGGECSVDIFLRRKDGELIDDPGATFGADFEVTEQNIDKAFHVCKILAISGGDDIVLRGQGFARCVFVVARMLQRDEDLRKRRARPLERTAHATRPCSRRRSASRALRVRRRRSS
jgi:hypothetical protein